MVGQFSTLWIAPLILLLYLLGLLSPHIRGFSCNNAGKIVASLPGVGDSTTLLGLIIAALAIVGSIGEDKLVGFFEISVFWLGASLIFVFAHILLTRQVTAWTAYFASAAVDSGWWSLAWSIWALLNALVPGGIWVYTFLIVPAGVLVASIANLVSMRQAERRNVAEKGG
jgi:hypothetical protein